MWRNLAASRQTGQDHELSVNARDALASLMTPAQVAEAQRLAREWDAAHPRSAMPFISQRLMRGGDVIEWINDGLASYQQESTPAVEVTPVEEVTPEEIAELRERGEVAELRALAEQGNAFAQDNLGDMYAKPGSLSGSYEQLPVDGVPEDDVEAVRLYRLAAEQGHARAQFNLGYMYAAGDGVQVDFLESLRLVRLAAEQGYWPAHYRLGLVYRFGAPGAPEDHVQAHMWFNLAASRSTGRDRERAIDHRDTVAFDLTPEQIVEAQRLSRDWDAAHPREP